MLIFVGPMNRLILPKSIFLFIVGLLALTFTQTASAQTTYFPAKGFYNGFLNQLNILECDNSSPNNADMSITLITNAGQQLNSVTFPVAGFGSHHLIINDHYDIVNSYGVFELDLNSGQPGSFDV